MNARQMTREEAINLLDLQLHGTPEQIEQHGSYEHATAIRMAIVALKTEDCEDAVSREAALKGYIEIKRADGMEVYAYKAVPTEYINNLPPVTPKQRTGKWIYTGDYITDGMLKCSSCEYEHDVADRFLYCPNCGAKMEGESE